jgi:WD40 repeat protein
VALAALSKEDGNHMQHVRFSRDGTSLFVVDSRTAARHDSATGKQMGRALELTENVFAINADATQILIGPDEAADTLSVIDTATAQIVARLRHEAPIVCAAFRNTPKDTVLTICDDKTTWLWNLREQTRAPVKWLQGGFDHVAFSADGCWLLTISTNGRVTLWNANAGPAGVELVYHQDEVRAATFAPNGLLVATGGVDGTVQLWDTQGTTLGDPFRHPTKVTSIAFSVDGKVLAVGGEQGVVRLWDVEMRAPLCPPLRHHHFKSVIRTMNFSPDGRGLAIGVSGPWSAAEIWRLPVLVEFDSSKEDEDYWKCWIQVRTGRKWVNSAQTLESRSEELSPTEWLETWNELDKRVPSSGVASVRPAP